MGYENIRIIIVITLLSMTACASIPTDLQLIQASKENQLLKAGNSCQSVPEKKPHTLALAALDANNISLLNWNIYKQQRSTWRENLVRLMADKDIVLLQEAHLDQAFQTLLQQQGLNWSMNNAFYLNGVETGVLNASRIQPVSTCGMRMPEPLIRVPKTILIQTFKLHGRDEILLVANIHGINFTPGSETYARQMKSLQAIIVQHQGPAIIAGDFNNWNSARSSIVSATMAELNMRSLVYENNIRSTVFGEAIDNIYYRGLDVITHEVIDTNASDHNPITASFRLSVYGLKGSVTTDSYYHFGWLDREGST
jgi:endonuclease/exonuclease/phosphatase (EEP) superfamily protein YafD